MLKKLNKMKIRDIILVLETYKSNPNIDIRDLHKLIDDKISWENLLAVFTELGQERLIKRINTIGEITKLGENRLSELLKEIENNRIESEKSKLDLILKKWQLKTFWWIFGIAFIGTIFSIINFIKDSKHSNNIKEQEIRIEKTELELSKLHTLILNQKKVDSLHNAKILLKTVE